MLNYESPIQSEYNWSELQGMREEQAEEYMLQTWGRIPEKWNDPVFRDQVTGFPGQAEIGALMNSGEQAYNHALGNDTRVILYERNIARQGHPGEGNWRRARRE